MKNRKEKRGYGFLKDTFFEIIFEVIWNIVMFIPRLLIRIIKEIW
ncbi:hypothetical protein [Neobacillus mesonae]|nr:hypothetical protein [Neobacillus mesonae]